MIRSIHALRALAVMLVLVSHIFDAAGFGERWAHSQVLTNFINLGAIGVDVFFVISGMVMSHILNRPHRESVKTFALKRLIRIYPNIIVFTLIFSGLACMLAAQCYTWKEVLYSCILKPGITGSFVPVIKISWSLYHEMYFYGLIALFMLLKKKNVTWWVSGTLLILTVLGVSVQSGSALINLLVNPINLEFLFGMFFYHMIFRTKALTARQGKWLVAFGVGALVTEVVVGYGSVDSFILAFENKNSWMRVLLWGLPSSTLVAGLTLQWGRLKTLPRWVNAVADASYALYLMQTVLFFLLDFMFHDAVNAQPYIFVVVILISFPAIAYGYHVGVEKRLTTMLKRLLLKNYVR